MIHKNGHMGLQKHGILFTPSCNLRIPPKQKILDETLATPCICHDTQANPTQPNNYYYMYNPTSTHAPMYNPTSTHKCTHSSRTQKLYSHYMQTSKQPSLLTVQHSFSLLLIIPVPPFLEPNFLLSHLLCPTF